MKTLWLPAYLRPHYEAELQAAQAAYNRREPTTAFRHLERAHILGQRWALPHTYTHLLMLRHGWRTRDMHEILGQVPRIVFGFFMSMFGRVPTGNTGGANVSPEQPMPIPVDLQLLLASEAQHSFRKQN
ncbi:DUF3703 domain-containing protein [Hymenobacter jeollabukensis]|uniref:DUF3703 domain-containing protein n=1 Tax=Hymenobacter jeollabukensis TaxID=2025313 RepID=A0A5R8WJS0_9BACT|nr:DUF3703 domain-containing protein [Hymenobacter jeollabukensis]TLM88744.1 DUF3703 domain-containing protein [Hymenobacter jeollabukensis]